LKKEKSFFIEGEYVDYLYICCYR